MTIKLLLLLRLKEEIFENFECSFSCFIVVTTATRQCLTLHNCIICSPVICIICIYKREIIESRDRLIRDDKPL